MNPIVIDKKGNFYSLEVPRHQSQDAVYDWYVGSGKANCRLLKTQDVYAEMIKSLGAFDPNHWQTRYRDVQGMPITNEYDLTCEGGLNKHVIQRILAWCDTIPSDAPGRASAKIQGLLIPFSAKHDLREWIKVIEPASDEVPVTKLAEDLSCQSGEVIGAIGWDGIYAEEMCLSHQSGDFCSDERHLWVILDGRLGEVIDGKIEIPERCRHNFMRVKFRF